MPERFTQLHDLSRQDTEDFTALLTDLSGGFAKKTAEEKIAAVEQNVGAALDEPKTFVLVHRDPDTSRIVASATGSVAFGPDPEGWVDDVVTLNDPAYRGTGLGEGLMKALHTRFIERGVPTVRLTSKPDRDAAGNLYTKLGYEEGGQVWRVTDMKPHELMVHANVAPNFTPVNCRIPTGNKAWAYGPAEITSSDEMAEDLRFTGYALRRVHDVGSVNYFTTTPDAQVTRALQAAGYEERDTRLYTKDLTSEL